MHANEAGLLTKVLDDCDPWGDTIFSHEKTGFLKLAET